MAGFFSNLPNVYVGVENNETTTYRLVKNLFRRINLEDQLERYVTAFKVTTSEMVKDPIF